MVIRRAAVLISLLALATACTAVLGVDDVPTGPVIDAGSSSSGTPAGEAGTTDDRAAAITAYTSAFCNKFRECLRPVFDFNYRDPDECTAAIGVTPRQVVTYPGISATAKDFQDCATKTSMQACDTFTSSDVKFACPLKGTRKVAEKCLSGWQCETGFCGATESECGACAMPPETGAKCADGACGAGLKCNANGNCVAESTVGQTCDDASKPCIGSLKCVDKVCVTLPDTANAPCDKDVGCATTKGLICLDAKCISFIVNGPDGECDYAPDLGEQPKFCRRFSACTNGKCAMPPNESQACGDEITGPGQCLSPLECTGGTCTKPKTVTCD